MPRSAELQLFIDAALAAFDRFAVDPRSRTSIRRMSELLQHSEPEWQGPGSRLPVCALLSQALDLSTESDELIRLATCFQAIEPRLRWDTKLRPDKSASANFAESHANGMILGPDGIEERSDLWLGVTLMAPHVSYPAHVHPPEETYLLLTPGQFRQGEGEWFSRSVGGTVYNSPGILHAMRSVACPFLTFWALPISHQ